MCCPWRAAGDPPAPDLPPPPCPQAGQVWFPDSALKTAQAIEEFALEGLPLFILANWRGFSGGQRDLFEGVLQVGICVGVGEWAGVPHQQCQAQGYFSSRLGSGRGAGHAAPRPPALPLPPDPPPSQHAHTHVPTQTKIATQAGSLIVDHLRTYKQPAFVYLPPGCELRGGAWVVIDSQINADMVEMYADDTAQVQREAGRWLGSSWGVAGSDAWVVRRGRGEDQLPHASPAPKPQPTQPHTTVRRVRCWSPKVWWRSSSGRPSWWPPCTASTPLS